MVFKILNGGLDLDYVPVTPPTIECVAEVSRRAEIPMLVLFGILKQEGGKPGMMNRNSNGSYDLGPMQINTIWLPFFEKRGVSGELLKNNGCINIAAGAVILKEYIDDADGDVWKAVGWYHSKTPFRSSKYREKIEGHVKGFLVSMQ